MTSLRSLGRGPTPWLDKERARLSREWGREANEVRRALKEHGVELSAKTDRIPTDLGDMLQVLRDLELSIDWLVSRQRKLSRKKVLALMKQIRNDIYIHLDYHFSGLRRPLDRLIEELDQGSRGRADRLLQVSEEQDSRTRRGRRGHSSQKKRRRKQETFSSALAWSKRDG